MSEGSAQLRLYLRRRRAGCPTEQAAAEAGFSIAEARLTDAEEAKGLLAHIDTTEPAPAVSGNHEEPAMARRSRAARAPQVEQVHKPDFDLARRIYFNDIKPAQGKVGEHAQEMSTAYKEIKKAAYIQPQAAKLAFKLVEMEESKRDDYLRSLRGLLTVFRIFIPADLVDQAEGKQTDGNVIPIGEASRPSLATIPADDSDLAGQPSSDDWHASLKEGDTVMVPVGEAGDTDVVAAKVMFIDGDALDVEYVDADETVKATVSRRAVSKPDDGDDQHQLAAE
jgi:hypothetical protein